MPPGMPPALAQQFECEANDGKTVKDLTDINSKSYIVPNSRFRKHCDLNPIWGDAMRRLSEANATKKKKSASHRALATRKFCLKGLHRMEGHNLMIDPGRRRCRACFNARIHGKPMTVETISRIKSALESGASLGEILCGKPIGGGPRDRSLVITTSGKFYHQREIDADFASFVDKYIADSNVIGQIARHVRRDRNTQQTDAVLPPELRPTVVTMGWLRHRLRTIAGGKYALILRRQEEKRYRKLK